MYVFLLTLLKMNAYSYTRSFEKSCRSNSHSVSERNFESAGTLQRSPVYKHNIASAKTFCEFHSYSLQLDYTFDNMANFSLGLKTVKTIVVTILKQTAILY